MGDPFGKLRTGVGGVQRKAHYFAMDLPYSDGCYVKAYPAETTESFCDGHVSAFAFLGGVPQSILYDNTTLAVAKILGDGRRRRTRVFSELQSHYLFEDRFGRPGVGNQHKWDSLGPERSGVWKSLGELPEGPVMKSSPVDGLSLHLRSAL